MDTFRIESSQDRGDSPNKIIDDFLDAMRAAGVNIDTGSNKGGHPIPDGKVHRADAIGQKNKKHVWYVLHTDHPASGAFGDYKSGIQDTWTVTKDLKQLSKEERATIAARIEQNKREREAEQKALHAEAVIASTGIMALAKKPNPEHAYLAKKGLPIFPGLRQLFEDFRYKIDGDQKSARAGWLVVPIYKPTAEKPVLVGAQLIWPDGTKRFVKGTDKAGNYHSIGKANGGNIFIGEGYATCARVHEATGDLVFVAFDSGNLKPVAINIRKKFPDARLILLADNDRFTTKPIENPGLTKAREAAVAVDAILAVPTFPDKEIEATDFDDLYRLFGIDAVRKTIADAIDPPVVDERNAPPVEDLPFSDPNDGRYSLGLPVAEKPEIQVINGKVHLAVDASIDVLSHPAAEIYSRGGKLVRAVEYSPTTTTISTARKRTNARQLDSAVRIEPVDSDSLVEKLTRNATFIKFNAKGHELSVDCPTEVARMVIARRGEGWEDKIPALRAVIQAPCLRLDGTVLTETGYDTQSQLLFRSRRVWPEIPEKPTQAQAIDAIDELAKLLEGFPFVANSDRSAAMGLLITAVMRPILGAAPMHAVSAPTAGTGKSLLVDVAAILATGSETTPITPTPDVIELEKRIGAAAIYGDAILNIDNVTHTLRSDQLCQMLTQPMVQVRVLGKSENVKIPSTSLICCTGNGLSLYGDLTRRTIIIRLDAKCDKPYEREFTFNVIEFAKQNRVKLVLAALTIVRAYIVAGMPDRASPMGSFTEWSDYIRSALIWLNMTDPRGDVDQLRDADPERLELQEIMNALPEGPFTIKRIAQLTPTDDDLRSALSRYIGRTGDLDRTAMGGFLRRRKDVSVDGRHIALLKSDAKHGSVWSVAVSEASE